MPAFAGLAATAACVSSAARAARRNQLAATVACRAAVVAERLACRRLAQVQGPAVGGNEDTAPALAGLAPAAAILGGYAGSAGGNEIAAAVPRSAAVITHRIACDRRAQADGASVRLKTAIAAALVRAATPAEL